MEFHNPKYLPQGMHEIITAFLPDEIYDTIKIVAYGHPEHPPHSGFGTGDWYTSGLWGYDAVTNTFLVEV